MPPAGNDSGSMAALLNDDINYLCADMIRVGKIVATHGINGALVLTHIVGNSKWVKPGLALHLEMQKGSYIPYFISGIKINSNEECVINIEDIDKVEAAKKLVTKLVYVDESVLAAYASQSPLLWMGFNLIDKKEGSLGKIEDVMQTGNQWIAKITYKNTEVLIPLIEQTINSLNIRTKTIEMTLPDGLLEVYLS